MPFAIPPPPASTSCRAITQRRRVRFPLSALKPAEHCCRSLPPQCLRDSLVEHGFRWDHARRFAGFFRHRPALARLVIGHGSGPPSPITNNKCSMFNVQCSMILISTIWGSGPATPATCVSINHLQKPDLLQTRYRPATGPLQIVPKPVTSPTQNPRQPPIARARRQ
jgi:hypothetical protein